MGKGSRARLAEHTNSRARAGAGGESWGQPAAGLAVGGGCEGSGVKAQVKRACHPLAAQLLLVAPTTAPAAVWACDLQAPTGDHWDHQRYHQASAPVLLSSSYLTLEPRGISITAPEGMRGGRRSETPWHRQGAVGDGVGSVGQQVE